MRVVSSEDQAQAEFVSGSSVVTIGNFDGVHLGHQALMVRVAERAKDLGANSIVYTFDPHPIAVLKPERAQARLFDIQDQAEQLQKLNIDFLYLQKFDQSFSRMSPDVFVEEIIKRKLKAKVLVVGFDFAMGADRNGDLQFLQDYCQKNGPELQIIEPKLKDGLKVSSTAIRQAVSCGDVRAASEMLGRNYYMRGIVIQGAQRGRTLGFPTANLAATVELAPKNGVYATRTFLPDGRIKKSITNIGVNPTFDRGLQIKIETHIFDFKEDIYGKSLKIELVERIRDEKKFNGPDELKSQIAKDVSQCLEILINE
jgi:riboflavin kinase / FMN adenylyltransferase